MNKPRTVLAALAVAVSILAPSIPSAVAYPPPMLDAAQQAKYAEENTALRKALVDAIALDDAQKLGDSYDAGFVHTHTSGKWTGATHASSR
jgi:hypothetical protein